MKSIDEEFRWKLLKAGIIFSILLIGLIYFTPDAKPKNRDEELLLKMCIPCYIGYLQHNSKSISNVESKK